MALADERTATLTDLRAAIGRARRPYRWTVAAFIPLAVMLPVLIAVVLPAVAGSAIGLTDRVPAVVQSVDGEPRADPDKKATWSVTVSWTDADGTAHRASENVSARQRPYQVGEQVDVGVLGDHVTLRPAGDGVWMLASFLGFAAVCLFIAFLYWRRSRAWVSLPGLVAARGPDRTVVVGAGRPLRRRPSRHLPLEKGLLLPFREEAGGSDLGVFVLDRPAGSARGSRMPEDGDELEIWHGDWASAVHRPADGAWWVTGVDSRGIDGQTGGEPKLSAPAKRLLFVLVPLGAILSAVGRWQLRDGHGTAGWSLLVGGFVLIIAAIVVMSRDRRRRPEKETRPLHSFSDG